MMKAILFVDDHEVLARLTCLILRQHGYRAESAYNASDALAMFDREKFDLLVTDYCMVGMNGLQLAKSVRQRAPDFPIIVVTGYPTTERGDEVDAWIDKHHMFPALLENIQLLLGETQSRTAVEVEALKGT
jgi:CheY-like chemotaxis protein